MTSSWGYLLIAMSLGAQFEAGKYRSETRPLSEQSLCELPSADASTRASHAGVYVSRTCPALAVRVWSQCPTLPIATASVVRVGVSGGDAEPLRELGGNHGKQTGGLSVGSVASASGKRLLLPGDHIIPNNLTMP